jgi:hypothetical protein
MYRGVPTGVIPSITGDSAIGMPFCALTSWPISCARASSSLASRSMAAARWSGAHCDQPDGSSKARRAAATAASTSARAQAAGPLIRAGRQAHRAALAADSMR